MKATAKLNSKSIDDICNRLRILTADLHVLYVKTLRCHWNMEDPRFFFLHELLDGQYKQLSEDVDLVAEQIRKLGRFAPGSLKEFLDLTRLKELTTNPNADKMLATLVEDYEKLIGILRGEIDQIDEMGDPGTADMLTEILRRQEKAAWVLRSHL